MSTLHVTEARRQVRAMILAFESKRAARSAPLRKLSRGKLYELVVLAWLLRMLQRRGFRVKLHGTVLTLKQAPSVIRTGDTHFEITHMASSTKFQIFTDVEISTLGSQLVRQTDLCAYHEVDIAVVTHGTLGRPKFTDLALGVECKSNATFRKSILKEALGFRRETAYLTDLEPSTLARAARSPTPLVPARPPSEYYVCYSDSDGARYRGSPSAFGIKFEHVMP